METYTFNLPISPAPKLMDMTLKATGYTLRDLVKNQFTGEATGYPVMINITCRRTRPTRAKDAQYPTSVPNLNRVSMLIAKSMNGVVYKDSSQVIGMQAVKVWATDQYPEGVIINVTVLD